MPKGLQAEHSTVPTLADNAEHPDAKPAREDGPSPVDVRARAEAQRVASVKDAAERAAVANRRPPEPPTAPPPAEAADDPDRE